MVFGWSDHFDGPRIWFGTRGRRFKSRHGGRRTWTSSCTDAAVREVVVLHGAFDFRGRRTVVIRSGTERPITYLDYAGAPQTSGHFSNGIRTRRRRSGAV
jgi:hypothetical protein